MMAKKEKSNLRPVIIAAVTAIFLMAVFGSIHRILAARLATPVDIPLISPEILEKLPFQMGEWTGTEVPLDEDIVRATDTDAHISRNYSRYNASEQVWLYVAYGTRGRDLMPHRPEVCYTGAGWTLNTRNSMEMLLSDGMKLQCTVFQFSRGTLNKKKLAVLHYYIIDGQYCRDVSLLRSNVWRGSGTVDYIAQVQIVTALRGDLTADSAVKTISAFAVESASSISKLFENAQDVESSDIKNSHTNNIFGVTGND